MPGKLKLILTQLNITPINTLFSISFLGGLLLTVLEINIYRDTFVSPYVPTTIWLITGVTAVLPMRGILTKSYGTTSFFMQMVFCIGSWGGIVVYVFMAANFYITSPLLTSEKLPVTDHGTMAKGSHGCGEPYVDIIYNGVEKQLVFPCGTETEKYKFAQLTIKKGLWGFNVITSKYLLPQ